MHLRPPRDDQPPGVIDTISGSQASSLWWRYHGGPIDDNFVCWGVRARTWETVVPASSVNSIATSPPPDHSGVMTWAHG